MIRRGSSCRRRPLPGKAGVHRIDFDLLHDCAVCENAVYQVIAGLAGEERAQVSVWNGKQGSGVR